MQENIRSCKSQDYTKEKLDAYLLTCHLDYVQGLQLEAAVPELQTTRSHPSKEVLRAAAFYKLHCELTAPEFKHSLLANALSASSTGAADPRPHYHIMF